MAESIANSKYSLKIFKHIIILTLVKESEWYLRENK